MLLPIALAASSVFSASYDCVLEVPKALKEEGGTATLAPIQFPGVAEGAWKFRVSIDRNSKGVFATVAWPDNPIQIAGKFAGMPIADGSVAFMAFSTGPCMFTETGCMSLVNLVDFGDGNAKIVVTPAALASDKAANTREPFVVVIKGKCTRDGNPK